MTLLRRYQNGDRRAVWEEIRKIPNGEACQNQPVLDVAKATMERVAQNADLLTDRLHRFGWRALDLAGDQLRTVPSPEDRAILNRIESISGAPMPVSIEAFWRTVGGINWVWDYDSVEGCPDLGFGIPLEELDPLCISPPRAIAFQLDDWVSGDDRTETRNEDRRYRLDLAPDYLHKANISGGDAYAIFIPSAAVDPVLEYERHNLPFVDYLRLAFKWSGFPDLEKHQQHSGVHDFVKEFGNGLIDF